MVKVEKATAIILAGGLSSRFGSNKALAPWRGATLIEWVIGRLREIFPRVIVVAKDKQVYARLRSDAASVVADLERSVHPLSGFQAGLRASPTWANFVTACDMPFPNAGLINALWQAYQGRSAAIGLWNGKIQPFFGFYSKRCLAAINAGLAAGDSIETILRNVNASVLSENEVRKIDPHGLSFLDLDTWEDYERAGKLQEEPSIRR
ncbi:MAG: molybdenum cofactor guanylyltransferase [Elusimicrobia bacterium]|nr:molybdenum cofactor guanylyltransferase [Elusimicrobiota bacterium]